MGTPYTFDLGMSCHSTSIELFYFDDSFRRYSLWVRPFSRVVAAPFTLSIKKGRKASLFLSHHQCHQRAEKVKFRAENVSQILPLQEGRGRISFSHAEVEELKIFLPSKSRGGMKCFILS